MIPFYARYKEQINFLKKSDVKHNTMGIGNMHDELTRIISKTKNAAKAAPKARLRKSG